MSRSFEADVIPLLIYNLVLYSMPLTQFESFQYGFGSFQGPLKLFQNFETIDTCLNVA